MCDNRPYISDVKKINVVRLGQGQTRFVKETVAMGGALSWLSTAGGIRRLIKGLLPVGLFSDLSFARSRVVPTTNGVKKL